MGIMDDLGKALGNAGNPGGDGQAPGGERAGSTGGGGLAGALGGLAGGGGLGGLGGLAALAGGNGGLVQAVVGMLGGGGLQQILSAFQQRGRADAVNSWVGTGANQPVSPDDVQEALGPERMGQLQQQTGLDRGALAGHLSGLLPALVDRLTPSGQVPHPNDLQATLGGLLGGR